MKIVKHEVPGEFLKCDEIPKVPTITMQSEAAKYTVELYKVASQCKDRLEKVRYIIE